MASAMIHFTVAKRINEVLGFTGLEEKQFLFGSIAPDIAKMIGSKREISHFSVGDPTGIPHMDRFIKKYKEYLVNPYELGYFVHLYTDVIWSNEFLPNFVKDLVVTTKAGERIKFNNGDEIAELLYNDYTNLNDKLLSYYNYDLSLFYEKFEFPINHIKEVDEKYFQDAVDKLGSFATGISNHNYIIDLEHIIHFVEFATIFCLDRIKEIDI